MSLSPAHQTVVASSVFLDLVGFSKHSTAVQVSAKGRFNAALRSCLDALGESNYWVRDLGDGALIICPGSPEHALFVALEVHRAFAQMEQSAESPRLELRIGLNLGALKSNPDLEGRDNYLGDGINATQRVMDFAQPGQILASRSFVDAIAFLHSDYPTLFSAPQTRQDKHGRSHDVYNVEPVTATLERLRREIEAGGRARAGDAQKNSGAGRTGPRGKAWLWAAALVAGAAALGGAFMFTGGNPGASAPKSLPPATEPVSATAPAAVTAPAPAKTPVVKSSAAVPEASIVRAPSSAAALPQVPVPVQVPTPTPAKPAQEKKPVAEKPGPDKSGRSADSAAGHPGMSPGPANAARCSALLAKTSLGESLSATEKQELQQSCRQ